jgi:hypothetical protein
LTVVACRAALLGVLVVLSGCGEGRVRLPSAERYAGPPVAASLAPEARGLSPVAGSLRFFVSGHSLVDQPLPDFLAGLLRESGAEVSWDRRYLAGSSIRQRGDAALPDDPYDLLLITEQHGLLGTLAWNDTVGGLRRWHDWLIAGNPRGRTLFYVPWLSRDDRDDPSSWIAYERAATPVWQCVVARVNADLAAAGRSDRIELLPANLALADLAGYLAGGGVLPGVPGTTARERLDAIFSDEVHLTRLGAWYIAAYTRLALDQGGAAAPAKSQLPEGITAEAATSLGRHAARFLAGRVPGPVLSNAACRGFLRDSFESDYWAYTRRVMRQEGRGSLSRLWSTTKWRIQTGLVLHDRKQGPFRDPPKATGP